MLHIPQLFASFLTWTLGYEPSLQGSYALGYNLAIEYLADYEKTWMLDSFKALNARVLAPAGRGMTEWMFLEVWTRLLDAGG